MRPSLATDFWMRGILPPPSPASSASSAGDGSSAKASPSVRAAFVSLQSADAKFMDENEESELGNEEPTLLSATTIAKTLQTEKIWDLERFDCVFAPQVGSEYHKHPSRCLLLYHV